MPSNTFTKIADKNDSFTHKLETQTRENILWIWSLTLNSNSSNVYQFFCSIPFRDTFLSSRWWWWTWRNSHIWPTIDSALLRSILFCSMLVFVYEHLTLSTNCILYKRQAFSKNAFFVLFCSLGYRSDKPPPFHVGNDFFHQQCLDGTNFALINKSLKRILFL